jgi:hypothetical protein
MNHIDTMRLALYALEANHINHQAFDDYDGYPASELFAANTKAIAALTAALAEPKDDYEVHMEHCNQGEHEGCCKYGEADCPALAEPSSEPAPFVTVNGCGSHHYTAENVTALVKYLRDCENGIEEPKWQDKDHRTFAGILWRVIQAACDDVPFTPVHQPLTDEEIMQCFAKAYPDDWLESLEEMQKTDEWVELTALVRAIEQAIRSKT